MNCRSLQEEIRLLGCADEKQVAALSQLYVELCEAKRITDIEYFYNHQLNLTYLLISDSIGRIDVYIPKPTTEKINLIDLNHLQHYIIERHSNIVTNVQDINLHLVTVDSNAVTIYYSHQLRLCELIQSTDLETAVITDSHYGTYTI